MPKIASDAICEWVLSFSSILLVLLILKDCLSI